MLMFNYWEFEEIYFLIQNTKKHERRYKKGYRRS